MTPLDWAALVTTIVLAVYLLVALLRPERFE